MTSQVPRKCQKDVGRIQGQPAATVGKGCVLGRVRCQAQRCETPADCCQRPLLVPVHAVGRPVAGVVHGCIYGVDDQENSRIRVRPVLSPQPKYHLAANSGKKNAMIITSTLIIQSTLNHSKFEGSGTNSSC